MLFHTLLMLWFAVTVVTILPKFIPVRISMTPKQPRMSTVKLFDGPHADTVHQVPEEEITDFFISPYLPLDENGMPAPDEKNIVHGANGMLFVKPSLAYYQRVTDEDYFYVRDIDESEFEKIRITGELPPIKAKDD